MKPSNHSDVSFKSNIVFVSPKTYKSICKNFSKNSDCQNIKHWNVNSNFQKLKCDASYWCGWRKNLKLGYTKGVRSCTAGVAVNQGKPASLFWHIENTKSNRLNLKYLKNSITGTNAIIIGSKEYFRHSKAVFEKFKRYTKSRNLPTSIFQNLHLHWQANLAYHSKSDTLYLCVNNIRKPLEYVNSMNKLKEVFATVQVSQKDNLKFTNPISAFLLRFKNFT